MVIWLIGLAGAGKTTIGREVHARLKERRPNVVLLDGDQVRNIMGDDLGYDLEGRRANAWRICRLCRFLDSQGIDVVCAILSIFHETQEWNRANYSRYLEVFIDVPFEILAQRDQKGLYSRASAGQVSNVAGVDIPFAPPKHPDLVLKNGTPLKPPAELAEAVIAEIDQRWD